MLSELQNKAKLLWCETLKLHEKEPGIRIASSLSCVDLLTVLYYGGYLHADPQKPLATDRDRFIASKGHGAVTLYPILADLGFIPAGDFQTIGSAVTQYGMIPDPGVCGIETVNGSLGHGLGVGLGMAISLKQTGSKARVIVLHGDGELGEGSVWEAVMLAGELKQSNLFMLLDVNRKSMLGTCRSDAGKLEKVFQAYGWRTLRCNGHDLAALDSAMQKMFAENENKPTVLLAETIKGYGVPELENTELAHVMNLKPERIHALLAEKEVLNG